jgi:hypothetical protein
VKRGKEESKERQESKWEWTENSVEKCSCFRTKVKRGNEESKER